MQLLIILPILVFFVLLLALLGRRAERAQPGSWQGAFLLATGLWGAAMVAMTEGLSLFTAIGRPGVALGWSALLALLLAWGRSTGDLGAGWHRMRSLVKNLNKFEAVLLLLVGGMALVLLAVVFAAPVNTVDVLQYHMPRVRQWAQNGSLGHFPTPHAHQNIRPYWAEAVMLHLRLLWGDDTPVELVNWFAWLALAVPASGSAVLFGADRRQAWLAAIFAWTIPTAVLHATTGMTDLPAAYWAAALGYFVLAFLSAELGGFNTLGIALSLALGMLTKGTFFPFAAALMGLWGMWLLWHRRWRPVFFQGAAVAVMVTALNAGFWTRNIQTYGGPYGRSMAVQAVGGLTAERGLEADMPLSTSDDGLGDALTGQGQKLVRMSLLHFVTPVGAVNQRLFGLMERLPDVFPPSYLESMKVAAWNNVMTGGSPVHWLLALAAIGETMIRAWRSQRTLPGVVVGDGIALLAGYLLLSLLTFAGSVFGTRYQLPFLALAAPLVSLAAPSGTSWLSGAAMGLLLIYAVPYALFNHTRPIVSLTPWPTKIESVFTAEDRTVLFALSPEIEDEYSLIARQVRGSTCQALGLKTHAKDLEYSLWWLLEPVQYETKIQHLSYPDVLREKLDRNFEPCAVICTVCGGSNQLDGMPLSVDGGHVKLYTR